MFIYTNQVTYTHGYWTTYITVNDASHILRFLFNDDTTYFIMSLSRTNKFLYLTKNISFINNLDQYIIHIYSYDVSIFINLLIETLVVYR